MKLRVMVDGVYVHVETLGEPEVRLYDKDGKYELLVRAIDVMTTFPTQEKLLILTRGSKDFVERANKMLLKRKQISSQEEFEEVLAMAVYVPPEE